MAHNRKMIITTFKGTKVSAGFYAGLFNGYSLSESCVFGSIAASASVEADGAQAGLKNWEELLKRFEGMSEDRFGH